MLIGPLRKSQNGEEDRAAKSGFEEIGSDSTVEGSHSAIVVDKLCCYLYIGEEIAAEFDVFGRYHEYHFDVVEGVGAGSC